MAALSFLAGLVVVFVMLGLSLQFPARIERFLSWPLDLNREQRTVLSVVVAIAAGALFSHVIGLTPSTYSEFEI